MNKEVSIKTYSHSSWQSIAHLDCSITFFDTHFEYKREILGEYENEKTGIVECDSYMLMIDVKKSSVDMVIVMMGYGINNEHNYQMYINNEYIHSFGDKKEAMAVANEIKKWAFS